MPFITQDFRFGAVNSICKLRQVFQRRTPVFCVLSYLEFFLVARELLQKGIVFAEFFVNAGCRLAVFIAVRPINIHVFVAELVGGIDVKVDTNGFANDLTTFKGKDDVLTLMIHLGYLAYDSKNRTVKIPNEEIKREFQRCVHEVHHAATAKRLRESEELFSATIQKNENKVAELIEKVHSEETVALHYNKEDSLRSVIKLAYYTYRDHYLQFEELPAGDGYADVVYIPLPDTDWPALVIELKWNKSAKGAIEQILDRKYPSVLENLNRNILLVGINYEKDASDGKRKHTCKIIEYKK